MTPPRRAWWIETPGVRGKSIMLLDAPATREQAFMAALARGAVLVGAALHAADLPPRPQLIPPPANGEDDTLPPPAPHPVRRGRPSNFSSETGEEA